MRSDYTQAYINRGDILIKLNRTKEAQEVYERALLYDSSNPDIYYNVSVNALIEFVRFSVNSST
jgi:predicted negative regulator of RcsB-dependent stress response